MRPFDPPAIWGRLSSLLLSAWRWWTRARGRRDLPDAAGHLTMVSPYCELHTLLQPHRSTRTPLVCRRATGVQAFFSQNGAWARLPDSCCHRETSGDVVSCRRHEAPVTTPMAISPCGYRSLCIMTLLEGNHLVLLLPERVAIPLRKSSASC